MRVLSRLRALFPARVRSKTVCVVFVNNRVWGVFSTTSNALDSVVAWEEQFDSMDNIPPCTIEYFILDYRVGTIYPQYLSGEKHD